MPAQKAGQDGCEDVGLAVVLATWVAVVGGGGGGRHKGRGEVERSGELCTSPGRSAQPITAAAEGNADAP